MPILRVLIEAPHAVFQQALDRRILGGFAIPRFDRGDVIAVDQEIVRINVARHLDQGFHSRRRQRRRVGRPRILDTRARRCRQRPPPVPLPPRPSEKFDGCIYFDDQALS